MVFIKRGEMSTEFLFNPPFADVAASRIFGWSGACQTTAALTGKIRMISTGLSKREIDPYNHGRRREKEGNESDMPTYACACCTKEHTKFRGGCKLEV